jgi:hypothetical protein
MKESMNEVRKEAFHVITENMMKKDFFGNVYIKARKRETTHIQHHQQCGKQKYEEIEKS